MSIRDAARRMASSDVGFLVVVDGEKAVGAITDRDIVLRAVAVDRSLDTPVAEAMTGHAVQIDEHATIQQAAKLMADKQCRRVAVTGEGGVVVGVLSLDDLLRVADDELHDVVRAVRGSRAGHPVLP
jgi:CBS domain-containing protein